MVELKLRTQIAENPTGLNLVLWYFFQKLDKPFIELNLGDHHKSKKHLAFVIWLLYRGKGGGAVCGPGGPGAVWVRSGPVGGGRRALRTDKSGQDPHRQTRPGRR